MAKKVNADEIVEYIKNNMIKAYKEGNCSIPTQKEVLGKYAFIKPYLKKDCEKFFNHEYLNMADMDRCWFEREYQEKMQLLESVLDDKYEICKLFIAEDEYDFGDNEDSTEIWDMHNFKVMILKSKLLNLNDCVCGTRIHVDYDSEDNKIVKTEKVYDFKRLKEKRDDGELIFLPAKIEERLMDRYPENYRDAFMTYSMEDIAYAFSNEEHNKYDFCLLWVWECLVENIKESIKDMKLIVKSQIANIENEKRNFIKEIIKRSAELQEKQKDFETLDKKLEAIDYDNLNI